MDNRYDRSAEDLGNIVALEHVNVMIPDQRISTLFYVTGLGLTRDPYMFPGVNNMWINVGRSQFHLPTGGPQKLRGLVGLVIPDLDRLAERLESVRELLADTEFAFARGGANGDGHIDVTSPWGNRYRCYGPGPRFGNMALGMPYVRFDVVPGAADGIARFYGEIIGAHARTDEVDGAPAAHVSAGAAQELVFRETADPIPEDDGNHIQVYVLDFSGPYRKLEELGRVSREDSQYQYRFRDIVDPTDGRELFAIEHEVRSMTHPLYARPLVNRNPDQTLVAYAPGHEMMSWSLPYSG